jgi:hypothetical protein
MIPPPVRIVICQIMLASALVTVPNLYDGPEMDQPTSHQFSKIRCGLFAIAQNIKTKFSCADVSSFVQTALSNVFLI